MKYSRKVRRSIAVLIIICSVIVGVLTRSDFYSVTAPSISTPAHHAGNSETAQILDTLAVKGRAPKTDYSRSQFGSGWTEDNGCDTRNIILHRDLTDVAVNTKCQVTRGTLHDPYTGKTIAFIRGETTSDDVQIDHVVALSDAWQTGAQALSLTRREQLANDPLELLAVDGAANQQKSDGDAATWLPSNKPFRCQYVARQIAVKHKYRLWVTLSEKEAMLRILETCPDQHLPTSGT